jgi:membrane protein DedA with SNARE-associated domain
MTDQLLDLVERYGYGAVFLGVAGESAGVPLPGETVLVLAAVAAGRGHLSTWTVAAVAWVAAVAGDNVGYMIGRHYGRVLFAHAPRRSAERADRLFGRWGSQAVFLGRFVAVLRMFAGPLAGASRMAWPRFFAANALGAAVWVAAVTSVGEALSARADHATATVRGAGIVGLAIAIAVVAVAIRTRSA